MKSRGRQSLVLVVEVALVLLLMGQGAWRAYAATPITSPGSISSRVCEPRLQPLLALAPSLQPCPPVAATQAPDPPPVSARALAGTSPAGPSRAAGLGRTLRADWTAGGLPLLLGGLALLLGVTLVLLSAPRKRHIASRVRSKRPE